MQVQMREVEIKGEKLRSKVMCSSDGQSGWMFGSLS